MIARWFIVGFALWAAVTAAFWFGGQQFFRVNSEGVTWAFLVVPIVMFAVTWGLLKVLGVEPGDQSEAASVIALPGLFIGTYEINSFNVVFSKVDPALSGTFAALMFLSYAAIIASGILSSRLVAMQKSI